jgi:hypothetical protein
MNRILLAGLFLAFVFQVPALADSAFDGTWKIDQSTMQMGQKPFVVIIKDGTYDCKFCVPEIRVKADGTDQTVTGHPYYDTVAVQIVDDHTIKVTEKKSGKVVFAATETVSADGKSFTHEFTDSTATNAAPVTGKTTLTRIAKGPKGSHLYSGSWRVGTQNMSDNALLTTYKVNGDTLTMSSPTGQSYSAKMDGSDSPYRGDPGITSVSVAARGKQAFVETDKRNGKVIGVMHATVLADGKTMKVSYEDKLRGATQTFTQTKQ